MHSTTAQPAFVHPLRVNLSGILYTVVLAILLTRSSLDTVLDIVQIDVGGGSALTLGAGINALLVGITALLTMTHSNRVPWGILTGWISFVAFCAVMSVTTPDPIGVARMLLVLISYQCAFMLPFFFIRSARDTKPLINAIIYSSIIPSAVAIAQITGLLPPDADGRLTATFTHPNIFAFYLLAVGAAIAYRLASSAFRNTMFQRLALIAYSGLLSGLLLATQTRSAWLGALVLLFCYAVFVQRVALLGIIALPVVVLFSPSIQERLLNILEPPEYIGSGVVLNSYDWRRQLWHDALVWINERPLSGHGGLGSFFAQSPSFFSLEKSNFYAHNVFVQLAFEVGYIGAILFFFVFAQKAWIFLWTSRREWPVRVIGATFCVVYLLVSYSDNMLYYLASNWYTFALLGALMASYRGAAPDTRRSGLGAPYRHPVPRRADALASSRQRTRISQRYRN
jgi:O-antigen ligase